MALFKVKVVVSAEYEEVIYAKSEQEAAQTFAARYNMGELIPEIRIIDDFTVDPYDPDEDRDVPPLTCMSSG